MSSADSMAMMLRALRLPAVGREYESLARQAESKSWGFEQYLKSLLELEISDAPSDASSGC